MKPNRTILAWAVVCLYASCAGDGSPDPRTTAIKVRVTSFLEDYGNLDFENAADVIHPEDLQAVHDLFIPVFQDAQASESREARRVATVFFSALSSADAQEVSPTEVYALMNRIVFASSSELNAIVSTSTYNVTEVRYDSAQSATAVYTMRSRSGESQAQGFFQLELFDSNWYIRMNPAPAEVEADLRAALAVAQ